MFQEEGGGVGSEVIYCYTYLKHIIDLWSVDWVKQMLKTNEDIDEKNQYEKVVGKRGLVQFFR